jgi:hypothetical protein
MMSANSNTATHTLTIHNVKVPVLIFNFPEGTWPIGYKNERDIDQ